MTDPAPIKAPPYMSNVICMECHAVYKRIISPPDMPGRDSHGYCPECTRVMEEKWHGRRPSDARINVEAQR